VVKVGFRNGVSHGYKSADPIDVVSVDRENLWLINAMVVELRDVKDVIGREAIGGVDAIGQETLLHIPQ
jgi:hypothetical protein